MPKSASLSVFFLLMLLLILAFVSSTEAALTWNSQQVKEYVWAGGDCQIAVDQNGNTHIAYLDGYTLVYSCYDSHEWINHTIATDGIYFIFGLALDSKGYPHILYEKKWEGPLKVANWNGHAWATQETGVAYTDFASLVVDQLGNPCIVYTTFTTNINHDDWAKNTVNTSLRYSKWTGTGWVSQTVDTVMYDSLSSISLTLSNSSVPYILYSPSSNLSNTKFATIQNSNWKIHNAALPPSNSKCGNIIVDSKGYVHFLYTQPYENTTELSTLLYVTFDFSTWNTQTVASGIAVGNIGNLALDKHDNPHFTFNIYEGDGIYVSYSGGGWRNETLPSGIGPGNLALDSSGNPHLLYRTGSPARYCSHLLYASANYSATEETVIQSTSDKPADAILKAIMSAVVVLAIIITATVLYKKALKSKPAKYV